MNGQLDETKDYVNEEGRDVNVIEKQLYPKIGFGTVLFEIILWLLAIIPGLIFLIKKVKAKAYLQKLQQKIQHNASQIDNYIEQRVVILKNAAALVEKATTLDKETMTGIAALRSGNQKMSDNPDQARVDKNNILAAAGRSINVAFEKYPELKSMDVLADAMQQNNYLQKEITAARELYNDSVSTWNQDIFSWPVKISVASKNKYHTRIPFSVSKATKEEGRQNFF